jgi:hypothetical protein
LHEMDFLRPPTVFAEPASNAKRELIRFAKRRTRAAVPRKPIWMLCVAVRSTDDVTERYNW